MTRMRRSSGGKGSEMGFGVASWNLFLHLLLIQLAHGREFTSDNYLRLPSSNIGDEMEDDLIAQRTVESEEHEKENNGHFQAHSLSHMDHTDPNIMVFFTMNDLKVGKTMPIYFPKNEPSPTPPRLLPRDEASSIPFSSKELPNLLKFFSFSQDSPQGRAMEDTLRQCENRPIKGENKLCATSLESMLDFTREAFGLEVDFSVVTTTYLTNLSTSFQNYTILEVPKEILAPKMVACHTMPYPYAVYYCHYQESENKVYKILLGGETGDKVEAIAVCHMDTSQWSHNHVSFQVLKIKPGTLPVCHFFPAENLVWIPTSE